MRLWLCGKLGAKKTHGLRFVTVKVLGKHIYTCSHHRFSEKLGTWEARNAK